MSSRPELKLDWCSYKAAKFAVEHWHYSRSMPVGKTAKIGVWESGVFIGAVVFAYGANNRLAGSFGLDQTRCVELVRVALARHSCSVSRVLAIAVKMLRAEYPSVEIIVSYADEREGHIGGIYKAAGWVYLGGSPGAVEYMLGSRWVHSMQVQTFIRSGYSVRRAELPKRRAGYKHKYVKPLSSRMAEYVGARAKPYPKRAVSIDNDAPATHAGEGGEIPTTALHISA